MSVPFAARPIDVYRALRALNPSPYMYFLDFGPTQVVGSSPEILVRLQGGEVTVRPIAGTPQCGDRKSVVKGKSVSVRVDPGVRRLIKKTKKNKIHSRQI